MDEDYSDMRGLPRPTQWALNRASQLGAAMARTERRILPALDIAPTCISYVQFLHLHRRQLEQLAVFAPWEAHLQRMVEQEERTLGYELTESSAWEQFHASIVEPMRCAFWYGWEVTVNLHSQYRRHLAQAARREEQVMRVEAADCPESPLLRIDVSAEDADDLHWEELAHNVFGSMQRRDTDATHSGFGIGMTLSH